MKHISFDEFCKMLKVSRHEVVQRRKEHQDFNYLGEKFSGRIDHHLIFSAISLSPRFDIKRIAEIGTCAGNGCRVLAELFPEASIETIDLLDNQNNENAKRILAPYKNVKRECFNSMWLSKMRSHQLYDLTFVDGCHFFPVVWSDILWGFCQTTQVAIFHDCAPSSDVMKSLEYLAGSTMGEVYIIDSESGSADIGVILKVA